MMEAIVLAGGLGTRLRAAVPDLPKPMAPVHGSPFLAHLLTYWAQQGITRFILATGYKAEQVRELGGTFLDAEIVYSEEPNPLGTGGALILAMKQLRGSGTFLLLNGDTYFPADLAKMRSVHQDSHALITVALQQLDPGIPERYHFISMDDRHRIISLSERSSRSGQRLINGGCYLMERSLAQYRWEQKFSLESELLPKIVHQGKAYGVVFNEVFIDIGVPEDYQRASTILKNRKEKA